jgi:predicted CXXCH cytochrome family protein
VTNLTRSLTCHDPCLLYAVKSQYYRVCNDCSPPGVRPAVAFFARNDVVKCNLFIATFVAFISLFVVSLSTAAFLTVHTPLDNALVDRQWLNLSLEIKPEIFDEVQLSVNGREPISVTSFHDGRFICQSEIKLSQGINKIILTGYNNGKPLHRKQLYVFYQNNSGMVSPPPKRFSNLTFHRWEAERTCIVCHLLDPDGDNSVGESSGPDACVVCHQKTQNGSFKHEPTDDGSCLSCHDRISKEPLSSSMDTVVNLCAECHEDSLDDWREQKYGHGPTNFGACTACHDPHAAEHPGLLRQHASDLCLSCHPEIASRPHLITTSSGDGHPFRRSSDSIGSTEEFSCASCHNPHAGNTPYFLNQYDGGPIEVFCVTCHEME